MTLVGECEVAPERCGAVIQAVSRHVCRAHIPGIDLLSQRSALRFADRGQIIGKKPTSQKLYLRLITGTSTLMEPLVVGKSM
ncbi:hypothetical protein LSH36_1525g00033 [Paralvinella palmiformis]|uniref:Uncharacterized protein n=1 Tax=Paralvinella palmiformis TaxID=53620 RepID=A0AAD9ISZ4_9ANNE|nr:hypothetical protein LSH36_1525g00033 [Paralvinella palmiformis]